MFDEVTFFGEIWRHLLKYFPSCVSGRPAWNLPERDANCSQERWSHRNPCRGKKCRWEKRATNLKEETCKNKETPSPAGSKT
ncbi:MAG TPA: hypothetical protein VIK39_07945, partial [Candidatus Angelobacter sp.]